MSSLFSSPPVARPQAPPPSPVLAEDAQQRRAAVARAAAIDLAASGRRTTEFAGRRIAQEAQIERGKRRLARAGEEIL